MFKPGDKVVARCYMEIADRVIANVGDVLTVNKIDDDGLLMFKEHPRCHIDSMYFKSYKPNFHLNYINLDVTVAEQVDKLEEEVKEVMDAVLNRDTENILEESMDVIQVILGLISTLELKDEFLEYNSQHQDKLYSRGHMLSRLV